MFPGSGAANHFIAAPESQSRRTRARRRGCPYYQFIENQVQGEPGRKTSVDLLLESLNQVGLGERIHIVFSRLRPRHGLREHGDVPVGLRLDKQAWRGVSPESGKKSIRGTVTFVGPLL